MAILDNVQNLLVKERELRRLEIQEREREIERLRSLYQTALAQGPNVWGGAAAFGGVNGTNLAEEGTDAVAVAPSLREALQLGSQTRRAALDAPALQQLHTVSLAGAGLVTSEVARLADHLQFLPMVRSIDLSANDLTDACSASVGARPFCTAAPSIALITHRPRPHRPHSRPLAQRAAARPVRQRLRARAARCPGRGLSGVSALVHAAAA